MTRAISFIASSIEINPKSDNHIEVELEVSEKEFDTMLGYFDEKDAIYYFGTAGLLQHMDVEEIRAFLNDIGVKTEWEDGCNERREIGESGTGARKQSEIGC